MRLKYDNVILTDALVVPKLATLHAETTFDISVIGGEPGAKYRLTLAPNQRFGDPFQNLKGGGIAIRVQRRGEHEWKWSAATEVAAKTRGELKAALLAEAQRLRAVAEAKLLPVLLAGLTPEILPRTTFGGKMNGFLISFRAEMETELDEGVTAKVSLDSSSGGWEKKTFFVVEFADTKKDAEFNTLRGFPRIVVRQQGEPRLRIAGKLGKWDSATVRFSPAVYDVIFTAMEKAAMSAVTREMKQAILSAALITAQTEVDAARNNLRAAEQELAQAEADHEAIPAVDELEVTDK